MATLSDYVSGTISLTTGSVDFTGSATGWLLAAFKEGDTIIDITGAMEYMGVVAEITSNTAGKLTKAWEGPTLVDAPYRMRYQGDNSRVAAQSRNLIELLGNGNLQAVAGLSGSANRVIMFTGPGTMTTIPKTELTSGADYDVQVDLLADRDAYDAQAEGFSVLVSDVGDGRSAIYSKASASSADWTDPAYVTGPIGETPEVAIGTVTTGAPGTDAEVTATPTVDGVELDFTIPAGEGFVFEGAYAGGTAYALGDVVRDAGSSWIALQPTTGNAPPTLPTTSNAYWELMAQKGQDGAGTGDVVGPASSVSDYLALFDGVTGKLLKAAGTLPDALVSTTLTADKAFRRGNVLGTVSQSAGVPSGAIIEQGSNSNGRYVRFADGTQICWGTIASRSIAMTTAYGAVYRYASQIVFNFPAAFVGDNPTILSSCSNAITISHGSSLTQGFYYLCHPLSFTQNLTDIWFAIGRWF